MTKIKNSATRLMATLVTLPLMLLHANAATFVTMDFSNDLESIPFGKTNAEVITWLESLRGFTVYEDRIADANKFYCFSAVQPFFKPGVKKNEVQEVEFHPHLVKKYVVEQCHSIFPYTFRFDLYFARNVEQKYTLFMVHRVCRVEPGAMKDIFRHELEEREKIFGSPVKVWTTTYFKYDSEKKNEHTLPAQVAQYLNKNGAVFFMMNDNGMLQFKEFLYVCSEGWNSYLQQLEKLSAWR
jgi:hypothetical protein